MVGFAKIRIPVETCGYSDKDSRANACSFLNMFAEENIFYFSYTLHVRVQSSVRSEKKGKCLTGYGSVKSEGLQAGELFAPCLLHTFTEDVLPGVQLQQLDAAQQLIGLLQALTGIFLKAGSKFDYTTVNSDTKLWCSQRATQAFSHLSSVTNTNIRFWIVAL